MHSNTSIKPVANFPNYRIGEDGTVWSCFVKGGKSKQSLIWWPMKLKPTKSGHFCVNLYRLQNTPERKMVHQLVIQAFVGPCPPKQEVRHLDGNGKNNHISNLRYGTKLENFLDSVQHGVAAIGEKGGNAKLTNQQVREIRQAAASGEKYRPIGERHSISRHYVAKIVRREIWAFIF